jgi:hypothetical protein
METRFKQGYREKCCEEILQQILIDVAITGYRSADRIGARMVKKLYEELLQQVLIIVAVTG